MSDSTSEGRPSFVKEIADEHEIAGSICKLPLHKNFDRQKSQEHKIVAGVYKRPRLRAPYDSSIVDEIILKSDRYQKLKHSVVCGLVCKLHKCEYFKKLAFSRLEENLTKQIAIFSKIINHKEIETKSSDELSHGIFSWTWNDFLTRRRLKNFVWIDILLRTDTNYLHSYKFRKDLNELQPFLNKIFDGLFSNIGDENVDVYQHIEKPIDEAKKVLYTTDFLEDEFYINCTELKNLEYKEYFFINAKRKSEDKLLKKYLENRIWNSHIWDPIEVRYQKNWFNNIVKQNQYHMDSTVAKYETDIAHSQNMLNKETFIDANYMDYCYSSIEMYKNQLIAIQDKLNKDSENMDNKLSDIRLQTDKLREQQKWLTVEIERFHEEEEIMRLRIEMRIEMEEQQKQMKSKLDAKRGKRKKIKKNQL